MLIIYQMNDYQLLTNDSASALKKKLRGFSPLANYSDRAIAAGQRS
jgi:hypothetical protein